MGDRLSEIKARWRLPSNDPDDPHPDVQWLVAEVERLQSELAYLRDHPGWVAPLPKE